MTVEFAEPGELEAALTRLLIMARHELAAGLSEYTEPTDLLDRLVRLSARLIPGAEQAGVALLRSSSVISTAAPTAVAVTECHDLQAALRQGPLFDLNSIDHILRIDDVSTDTRWPRFAARASDLGVVSMLVCDLPVVPHLHGALAVYSSHPKAFDAVGELMLPVFASRASIVLSYADRVHNLTEAIGSRQVIGQAVGIQMERHKLTAEDAFRRLVVASQQTNTKLREVAARVVNTGLDPDDAARG